jgi:hypothetical protein
METVLEESGSASAAGAGNGIAGSLRISLWNGID